MIRSPSWADTSCPLLSRHPASTVPHTQTVGHRTHSEARSIAWLFFLLASTCWKVGTLWDRAISPTLSWLTASQALLSKKSHSSEQAFADSPGELTTSRKLGWQQMLAKEPRQLFSHYSITSWQAGCTTPIGTAPSTGSPGDHRETAWFSYHLGISKDLKGHLVWTQDSFLRNPCLLHHWKFVSVLGPNYPQIQINHSPRRIWLLKLLWQSLIRSFNFSRVFLGALV